MSQLTLRPERFDPEAQSTPQPLIDHPRNYPPPNWHASEPHSDAHSPDEPRPCHPNTHLQTAERQTMRLAGERQKELPTTEGYLHFITLPRFSTSPIRYRSASAARDAFEQATSTWVVILFTSCWAHLNWSHKFWIKDNSLGEGARLSIEAACDCPAKDPPAIS
jgi:hypothetical protein